MNNVVWFFPAVGLSVIVSILSAVPLSRALRSSRLLAAMLVLSLGVIVSATLTPLQSQVPALVDRSCDFGRLWFIPLRELSSINDSSLNIVLFIPFGLAVGLVPDGPRRVIVEFAALMLPVAIEMVQLWASPLARGCQSADVIDNLTGLAIGLAAAAVTRRLVPSASAPRDPESSSGKG